MILTHLVLFGFLPGAGGAATAVEAETNTGGWYPTPREIEREEKRRKEKRRHETELQDEIEYAYARIVEGAPPRETVREVAQVVAPFVEGKAPTRKLAAQDRIDFAALARNIAAAERLLRLYQDEQDDEEAAIMLLTA